MRRDQSDLLKGEMSEKGKWMSVSIKHGGAFVTHPGMLEMLL